MVTNVPWLVLFVLGIATLSYVSIRNGCFTYYFKYYVGKQTVLGMNLTANDMLGAFLVVGLLASLFGTSLVAPVAQRIGKRQLYMIMMGISSVITISFYFLRPEDVIAMFVLQILANLIMGPTTALVYAMYADASDYSEWKTGRRSTGLVFAASSFAQKMGWTVGGAVTGLILAGFGYQAEIKQTAETLTGLKLLVSFIPAVGSVLATILPLLLLAQRQAHEGDREGSGRTARSPSRVGPAPSRARGDAHDQAARHFPIPMATSTEAREYVITRPDTPTPWFNFIGEGRYGGIVSNAAGGFAFDRDPEEPPGFALPLQRHPRRSAWPLRLHPRHGERKILEPDRAAHAQGEAGRPTNAATAPATPRSPAPTTASRASLLYFVPPAPADETCPCELWVLKVKNTGKTSASCEPSRTSNSASATRSATSSTSTGASTSWKRA